ncbi:ABC transporter ATP-binding protein [Halobacillus sp. Marseille-Q1614]|uniref:ABC transporter ATP-binding protein n=1 Tax=Halobacillus sp. Marseille-Q1614 TaxID=2709134 RepID=UPI00156DDE84|nr:ABC transporter ATP-binding protein [Halobacillus sp. Marseille-Q1614]
MTKKITVQQLIKNYDSLSVINGLSFALDAGEHLSIVGPSGSGKTTLLRILAGLEKPSAGSIYLTGQNVSTIPARKRSVGFVFQQPLLFPHMTVEENIQYGAKLQNISYNKVNDLLEATSLYKAKDQFPAEISGGQQQRASLARSLAAEPDVLLLDEPFSSLDPSLRQELRYWVRDLLKKREVTSIFVTHDYEEAMLMGDRIGVFHEGTFQQIGTAEELHNLPANPFVARFLGGHLVLEDERYIPLDHIQLYTKVPEQEAFEAEVLQTTFHQGQRTIHLYISSLDRKLSLPVHETISAPKVYLSIPSPSVQSFTNR